jgi:phospholipid/cholesterol/gamma-HCH transport system ATP-binding protein
MEIGERILFLKDRLKVWEGTKEEIFRDNQVVVDFCLFFYLFKKVREGI